MATKHENLGIETAHFNNFKNFIPGFGTFDTDTVHELLELGLIQVSTAFEHAVASVANLVVESQEGKDLSDGSDCKLSTVRTSSYGQSYSAAVGNVHTKTGALRVQVYERELDQFYYFVIPSNAYNHIKKTSNIEIPFELSGLPKRVNKCTVNWWRYEVETFQEMCMN
jgi:hypothetical protein